jgi:hypothetical protein
MPSATDYISREAVLNAINQMPDRIPIDALLDEIIYLYKVKISLQRSSKGEGISLEDFREKVKSWPASK